MAPPTGFEPASPFRPTAFKVAPSPPGQTAYKLETVGFEPTPDKSDKITLTPLHSLWGKFPYWWAGRVSNPLES